MHYRISELTNKKINAIIDAHDYLRDLPVDEAHDICEELELAFPNIDFQLQDLK